MTRKYLVRSYMFTLGTGAAMDSREDAEAYVERAMKHFPGSRYKICEDTAGDATAGCGPPAA